MRQRPTAQPISDAARDVEQAQHGQRPGAVLHRQPAGGDRRPAGAWPGRPRGNRTRRNRRPGTGNWAAARPGRSPRAGPGAATRRSPPAAHCRAAPRRQAAPAAPAPPAICMRIDPAGSQQQAPGDRHDRKLTQRAAGIDHPAGQPAPLRPAPGGSWPPSARPGQPCRHHRQPAHRSRGSGPPVLVIQGVRKVPRATSSMPANNTLPAPTRSAIAPANGWVRPHHNWPKANARLMLARPSPVAVFRGLRNSAIDWRTPMVSAKVPAGGDQHQPQHRPGTRNSGLRHGRLLWIRVGWPRTADPCIRPPAGAAPPHGPGRGAVERQLCGLPATLCLGCAWRGPRVCW
jgi:hypothetical protein